MEIRPALLYERKQLNIMVSPAHFEEYDVDGDDAENSGEEIYDGFQCHRIVTFFLRREYQDTYIE